MVRILFVGYGLSENRREAVSINTAALVNKLNKNKVFIKKVNIGYSDSGRGTIFQMLFALVNYRRFHRTLSEYIVRYKITHVYDTFVLPGASVVFTVPVIKKFPQIKFIKEIHNNFGNSKSFGLETFIRLVLNTRKQLKTVRDSFEVVIARKYWFGQKV